METSSSAKNEALKKQISSGTLSGNKLKVLDYIKRNDGINLLELRDRTGMAHQTLTSVISKLMDAGFIYFYGTSTVDGEVYSKIFYSKSEKQIIEVLEKRENEKFVKWLKTGFVNFRGRLEEFDKNIVEHLETLYGMNYGK